MKDVVFLIISFSSSAWRLHSRGGRVLQEEPQWSQVAMASFNVQWSGKCLFFSLSCYCNCLLLLMPKDLIPVEVNNSKETLPRFRNRKCLQQHPDAFCWRHDDVTSFKVFSCSRAIFWLVSKIRRLYECSYEDLPKNDRRSAVWLLEDTQLQSFCPFLCQQTRNWCRNS